MFSTMDYETTKMTKTLFYPAFSLTQDKNELYILIAVNLLNWHFVKKNFLASPGALEVSICAFTGSSETFGSAQRRQPWQYTNKETMQKLFLKMSSKEKSYQSLPTFQTHPFLNI